MDFRVREQISDCGIAETAVFLLRGKQFHGLPHHKLHRDIFPRVNAAEDQQMMFCLRIPDAKVIELIPVDRLAEHIDPQRTPRLLLQLTQIPLKFPVGIAAALKAEIGLRGQRFRRCFTAFRG